MRLLALLIFTLFAYTTFAQSTWENRLVFDPALFPFYHGVASGDPTDSQVMLWTRVTANDPVPPSINVNWRIATDASMTNIVQTGTTITDASRDYTVKIDVTGLNPKTYYYYDFQALGMNSVLGRTKTLPATDDQNVEQLRFAVASCSSYAHGYFNSYRDIINRNDIDAVLHLGDYIYEYGDGEFGDERLLAPDTEIINLADYRTRYSYYRLDPDLRELHQQYPFFTVWDDHESANDAYKDGAQNHDPATEGTWVDRKNNAMQVYEEWMPIRSTPSIDGIIYRSFKMGELAEVFFLDTRLIGRDDQGATDDSAKNLLGADQFNWLIEGLERADNENTRWKIIAQQVMIAPLEIAGAALNDDQWDGYATQRTALLNEIKKIDNIVVLTGDIHTSWANDIPLPDYMPNMNPCTGSAGVEFVTTSVTSPGLDALGGLGTGVVQTSNEHVQYVNLNKRGYMILDLTPDLVQADWYYVSTVTDQTFSIESTASYNVNAFERCTQQASGVTTAAATLSGTAYAPNTPLPTELPEIAYFNAWNENQYNHLHWKQNNPYQLDGYFVVERGADNLTFEHLDILPSQQAEGLLDYNWIDQNPIIPKSYYRIVYFSQDGRFVETQSIKVKQSLPHDRFDFFPNPAVHTTNCSFYSETEEEAILQVFDTKGRLLKRFKINVQTGQNQFPIDLSNLESAFYTIAIHTSQSKRYGYGNIIKIK